MSQNGQTLKTLQNLLQDFCSVSDRFEILCIKGLRLIIISQGISL